MSGAERAVAVEVEGRECRQVDPPREDAAAGAVLARVGRARPGHDEAAGGCHHRVALSACERGIDLEVAALGPACRCRSCGRKPLRRRTDRSPPDHHQVARAVEGDPGSFLPCGSERVDPELVALRRAGGVEAAGGDVSLCRSPPAGSWSTTMTNRPSSPWAMAGSSSKPAVDELTRNSVAWGDPAESKRRANTPA